MTNEELHEQLSKLFDQLATTIRDRDGIVSSVQSELDRRAELLRQSITDRFGKEIEEHRAYTKALYTKFERLVWAGLVVVAVAAAIVGYQTTTALPAKIDAAIGDIAKTKRKEVETVYQNLVTVVDTADKAVATMTAVASSKHAKFHTDIDHTKEQLESKGKATINAITVSYQAQLTRLRLDEAIEQLQGKDQRDRHLRVLLQAFPDLSEQLEDKTASIVTLLGSTYLPPNVKNEVLRTIEVWNPQQPEDKEILLHTRLVLGSEQALSEIEKQLKDSITNRDIKTIKTRLAAVEVAAFRRYSVSRSSGRVLIRTSYREPQIDLSRITNTLLSILTSDVPAEVRRQSLQLISAVNLSSSNYVALADYLAKTATDADEFADLAELEWNDSITIAEAVVSGAVRLKHKPVGASIFASASELVLDALYRQPTARAWELARRLVDEVQSMPEMTDDYNLNQIKARLVFQDAGRVNVLSTSDVMEIHFRDKEVEVVEDEDFDLINSRFEVANGLFHITALRIDGSDEWDEEIIVEITISHDAEPTRVQKLKYELDLSPMEEDGVLVFTTEPIEGSFTFKDKPLLAGIELNEEFLVFLVAVKP